MADEKAAAKIKADIARWVLDSLDSSESPRCHQYPKCGGEGGAGALEWPEHASELSGICAWTDAKRWTERRAEIVGKAPRCDDCMKYARAVERLLSRFRKQGDGDV